MLHKHKSVLYIYLDSNSSLFIVNASTSEIYVVLSPTTRAIFKRRVLKNKRGSIHPAFHFLAGKSFCNPKLSISLALKLYLDSLLD